MMHWLNYNKVAIDGAYVLTVGGYDLYCNDYVLCAGSVTVQLHNQILVLHQYCPCFAKTNMKFIYAIFYSQFKL